MRADIHDGPEHNGSNVRPDTLMQDPKLTDRRILLQRTAAPYIRVKTSGRTRRTAAPPKSRLEKSDFREVPHRWKKAKKVCVGSPLALYRMGRDLGAPHFRIPQLAFVAPASVELRGDPWVTIAAAVDF
jgi:hypothetical protein